MHTPSHTLTCILAPHNLKCTHTPSHPHMYTYPFTGFAELQTDLDELTGDVAGCHLPYLDIQSYLIASLFPGARDHPVMHVLQVRGQRSRSTVQL